MNNSLPFEDAAYQIDENVAVLVCAGPSLDRMTSAAWEEVRCAGAVVAINGALAAHACRRHRVGFDYAAAMDVAQGLIEKVPGFATIWDTTAAWRVTAETPEKAPAESYVVEVEWWSDDPREGYVGGSTAMVIGNWLCNPWPDDSGERAALETIAAERGKPIPPRGFKRLVFVGLDMAPGQGGHARGAGDHQSGFSHSPYRFKRVCSGWRRFYGEATKRGIEVVNLTPGSGLPVIPRPATPGTWLRDR